MQKSGQPYIDNSLSKKDAPVQYEPQSKFTPLQLIPPINDNFKHLKSMKSSRSQNNSKIKVKKVKQKFPSLMEFDEMQTQDDELEFNAYNIKPFDSVAPQTFRNIYKKIDTILQKKTLYQNQKMSLFSSVAESSKIEKLMPRTLGLIRPNTNNNKILDASNFCMGDKYAKVLCSGVKLTLDYYEQLNLKNNNLTSRSSECLNQLIPTKLKGLNLQGNSLGQGGQEFVKALNTRYGQLQYLNLENNKFNDDGCRQLFKMLQENTIMQKLNLSHNLITDKSMPEFNMLLQKNATLSEIYLHWNRIHQIGGQYIIAALFINYNVKVLDLSFNSLGIRYKDDAQSPQKNRQPYQTWPDYFSSKNCNLIHLDLSNNQFNQSQSEAIAKALEDNHNIFGFHFSGNIHSSIDHLGFLNITKSTVEQKDVILKKNEEYQSEIIGALQIPRIDGLKQIQRQSQFYNEVCWICDGWVECTFLWQPNHLDIKREPLFIHLSHERYAPIKLELMDDEQRERSPMSRKSNSYKIWYVQRMVPSKQPIRFFFSSPLLKQAQVSSSYDIVDWPKSEQNKKVLFYMINEKPLTFRRPRQCNQIILPSKQQFDELHYEPSVHCKPRIKDYGGILDLIIDDTIDENIDQTDNFFKECHRDSDQEFSDCFEWDWNNSQLTKLIKEQDQLIQVKQYLHRIYRDLVSAYRHYSAYSPSGDIWSISLNVFTDIFQSSFVDNKSYLLKDLDISFRQTTSKYINQTRTSTSHALLRHQFIEILVRMSMDKYCKQPILMTPLEALQRVYEVDGLQKKIESVQESQTWRDVYYWSMECNRVIQNNQSVLRQLYQECVQMRQLNYFTNKLFASPQSFKELFNRAGLINDVNAERNVLIAFALSVPLVLDEINQDRQIQMSYQEFVEALARVAEKYGQNKAVISSEQLALKLQHIIGQLQEYYQIVDENKIIIPQMRQSKKQTNFLQENVTKLLYEIDGSPINAPQIYEYDFVE
ncbi:unnamed protein product [Paramecium primaurelia]|uniref:Leucine Rich Repeat family protein n=2 Tax=Paramecium primaurelia TaxID=5886 RepID=A0A8S1MWA8_PARPR|nr:unnamed protein product [Paramecium primaurelia]